MIDFAFLVSTGNADAFEMRLAKGANNNVRGEGWPGRVGAARLDLAPGIHDGGDLHAEVEEMLSELLALVVIGDHDRTPAGRHAIEPGQAQDAVTKEDAGQVIIVK